MVLKEECGICGRVLPIYKLRKCARCGRFYCQDCMVEDVTLPLPSYQRQVCLKCAAKVVSPKIYSGKYGPLTEYLVKIGKYTDYAKLSFGKIESILGQSLPESAYNQLEWWKNVESTRQGYSWILAGWQVKEVSLDERMVVFERVTEQKVKRRRRKAKIEKPFKPVPVKRERSRRVSRTKIAKLVARMQNIERKRKAGSQLRGKFKPKPAYEKKLYKANVKPKKD